MRIARYTVGDEIYYGIVELAEDQGEHPDTVADLSGHPMAETVRLTGQRRYLADVRLLAPIIPSSKVIGIGRNYVEHARELGNEVPSIPLTFLKPNTSVIGPEELVIYPPESSSLHYEGELAVVIGTMCRRVPAERVADVIFGYTCANDVTARDLQKGDGQWTRGKGYDTFCPLGPWIVTHLGVDDMADVHVWTRVNGEVRQDDSTALMVYKIPQLIEHVSSFTTLLPGDVILTGTPKGVGEIQVGDEVEVEIEGIGVLRNRVAADA